jgi:hypothetical protein
MNLRKPANFRIQTDLAGSLIASIVWGAVAALRAEE